MPLERHALQLGDILNGETAISGTAVNDTEFYADDLSITIRSGQVVAILSKSGITGQQAFDILSLATHNSTNAVIGVNRTMATNDLYLMHLPKDALFFIPVVDLQNSPTGAFPQTWVTTIVGKVVTIGNFFMHSLVNRGFTEALGSTVVLIGLMAFSYLNDLAEDAMDAYDQLVDAFNAFVQGR